MLNNLRETLSPALEKIGKGFASTGLSPNFWTCVGLAFALISAVVYGLGIEFGLTIGKLLGKNFEDVIECKVNIRISGHIM